MRTRAGAALLIAGVLCAARAASSASETEALAVAADADTIEVAVPGTGPFIVEIDGYDVTAVVRLQGGVLTVPARGLALTPGEHRLRVLVSSPNGDLDTVLEKTLDVAGSASTTRTQSLNLLLGSAWRVAENPDEDYAGVKRDQQRGTLQWSAARESEAWALRGTASALYDTVTTNSPGGDVWQAPGYLLQAERRFDGGSVGVALGDDQISLGNLLFSGYGRRGLRVDASALADRLQFQAFTLNSEALTRVDADIVPASDTGSVQGGYATAAPIAAHPEWLRITSGYVSGDTTLGGIATTSLDPVTRFGGRAWNAALDSWMANSALWLHAEYARSRFDSDGLSGGDDASDDDAVHFAGQLVSSGSLQVPGFDSWALGFEHQRVGAHFYSLGNLALPGDLELDHASLRFGTHGVQLSADDSRYQSNVDDDPARARREGEVQVVNVSWSPPGIDPTAGLWRFIGSPTLSAEWQTTSWKQDPDDAPLAGFDLDNRQRVLTFGLDLSRESVSLSLRHTTTDYDDRSAPLIVDDFEIYTPLPDTREETWSAQLYWMAGDRFTLAPALQSTTLRDLVAHTSSRNTLWGLQGQATLKPERLWLQASYSESRDRAAPFSPTALVDTLTSGGGATSLVYRLHRASGRLPDIDISLSGQYGRAFEHDAWQAMLGFTVNWNKESP